MEVIVDVPGQWAHPESEVGVVGSDDRSAPDDESLIRHDRMR